MSNLFPKSFKSVEILNGKPSLVEKPFLDIWDDDGVVVAPILLGICRSDLKEILGVRALRHDFGHEIVGNIEWASRATALGPGDTVCFDPHIEIARTSGFGEFIIAHGDAETLERAFIKVPKEIPAEKLVFCEPMACAHHCIWNLLRYLKCESLRGYRVGVIGAGNAGSLIGLLTKHLGASVTIFNRSNERLKFLIQQELFSPNELGLIGSACQIDYDVIIATTSFLYPSVMDFAVQVVRRGGIIILYGGTQEGDFLPDTNLDIDRVRRTESLVNVSCRGKCFRVGGSHGALRADFMRVVSLLKTRPLSFPIERLISCEILLDQLPEALASLTNPQVTYYGKIVVRQS
jgi:threonine dehydrogenase-like Zn-dependent dehydrogenase